MSYSNGKITAPVNTDDVSAVLGVASHDVGYLCSNQHKKINKWSNRKPVLVNGHTVLSDTDFQEANFGLKITSLPYDELPSAYTSAFVNNGWDYELPSEKQTYFRLADFDGYDHAAVPPFAAFDCPTSASLGQHIQVVLDPNNAHGFNMYNVLVEEFWLSPSEKKVGDCFLGIVWIDNLGHTAGFATSVEQDAGNVYAIIRVPRNQSIRAGSQYTVYPFYATAPIVDVDSYDWASIVGGTGFLPIPCIPPVTMTIS